MAYILLVGVPVLGLLGIMEAGRNIAAPRYVGGEWTLQFDPTARCAGTAALRQPELSISQSGTAALIALNDGHATVLEATVDGTTLSAKSLSATIAGKGTQRTLEGTMSLQGCAPVSFRAVRQVSKKSGE